MLSNRPHAITDFKHRLRIAKAIFPARRKRAKLPRKVPPRSVALSYYRAISPILERARQAIERALAPLMPELERQAAEVAARRDAASVNETLDRVGESIAKGMKPAEIEALAERYARATSDWEREQAAKQTRAAFGVDVLAREPNIAARSSAFVSENVALIKSIPAQYLADVEKRVARAVASGATPKELAAEIAKAHRVADDRAMLIARDQIGKYYGAVAQARQQAMGVTHYVWRTSNDERVREEHAAREGEIFAWNDPPEGGNPGYEINCRCYGEPVLDQLLEGDEPHAQELAARGSEEGVSAPEESAPEPVSPSEADLAAARAAHAAEVERRLAEQEAARVERALAAAERERLKAAAEEQARRAAAAEAALAAARPRSAQDLLARQHAEESAGVSARTANQREAELARLATAPADLPRLAGLASGEAAGVREELDKLIARTIGARLSPSDLTRKEVVLTTEPNMKHEWGGTIVINEREAAGAGRFVESRLRNETPAQLADRQRAYEQRLADLTAKDNELSAKIRAGGNVTKKQALVDERAAVRAELATVRGTVPPVEEKKSMQSLIHEAMHGHSPIAGSGAYSGAGHVTEEVTTELAARTAMEDSFPGYRAPGHDSGAYKHFIEPLTNSVAEAAGVSPERAFEVLRQASVDVKRDHIDLANTPAELRDKFAAKVAARVGGDARVRERVARLLEDLGR